MLHSGIVITEHSPVSVYRGNGDVWYVEPGGGGGGGDLVPNMPGCVCPKVKDMGPFSASRE